MACAEAPPGFLEDVALNKLAIPSESTEASPAIGKLEDMAPKEAAVAAI